MHEQDSPKILSANGQNGRQEITPDHHAGPAGDDARIKTPKKGIAGVYSITNIRNGKRYIGSASRCIKRRLILHLHLLRNGKHHSKHLQAAWVIDGERSFQIEILLVCSAEECLQQEQAFMDLFKSASPKLGYNIQPVVGSPQGTNMSAETKAKISAANKGRIRTPEQRARMSAGMKGKIITPEHRAKIGAAFKGRKFSPEAIQKMCAARARQVRTPETFAKISASLKARQLNPETRQKPPSQETRAKLSVALRGRPFSEEHRARISEGKKGTKASEETKKKMREARRGLTYSEEARANMCAAQLLSWQKRKANGPVLASEETRRKMSEAHLLRHQRVREAKLARLASARHGPIIA